MPEPVGQSQLYRNPLRHVNNVVPNRVDQGVDYSGTGPIYALGPGEILQTKNSGWPGGAFIAERLTEGPYAGKIVYFAEDIQPVVQVGEHVNSDTVIGYFAGGDSIEAGWGAPMPNLGQALAYVIGQSDYYSGDVGDHPTAMGASFNNLMVSLGAPSGSFNGPIVGTVPKGYPPASGHITGPTGGPSGNPAGCINAMIVHIAWLFMLLWMAIGWR